MTKLASLTETQARTLRDIKATFAFYQKQFDERKANGDYGDNVTLSPWLSRYCLEVVHHTPWRQINALIKNGFLVSRASNTGCGTEVRLIEGA